MNLSLGIWEADFNPEIDTELVTQVGIQILDTARTPMVVVIDMRLVPLSFEGILFLANHGLSDELKAHPRFLRLILIASDEVVAIAAGGMDSEAFGFVKIAVVPSDEEALVLARQRLT